MTETPDPGAETPEDPATETDAEQDAAELMRDMRRRDQENAMQQRPRHERR